MEHAVAVDVPQREQQLREPIEGLRELDALACFAQRLQPMREVATARVLHRYAELPLLHERAVVPDDERVLQARQDVDLALGHLLVGGRHVRHRYALVHHQLAVVALHEEASAVATGTELADCRQAIKALVDRLFGLERPQAVQQLALVDRHADCQANSARDVCVKV